jgi:uncharacterized protein (TIGR03083 family)
VNRKAKLQSDLAEGRETLLSAIDVLAPEEWDRPTSNPGWTAREILAHVSQAGSGLLARMRRFLTRSSALPAGFDLNIWNNRQVAKLKGVEVSTLVAVLTDSRQELLQFLGELTDDQLDVWGWHASGQEMSLAEMFEIMAWHESTHAADILTARSGNRGGIQNPESTVQNGEPAGSA